MVSPVRDGNTLKSPKASIVIIVPHIPAYDTNAGDWRVWVLTQELSKKYNVFFCVINPKTNLKYKPKFEKYVKKIILLPDVAVFGKFLKFENISTVIFEKYFGIDYSKLLGHFALATNFIVDTHDIDYLKAMRAGSKNILKIKQNESRLYKMADALVAISNFDKTKISALLNDKKPVFVIPTPTESNLKKFLPFQNRAGIALWGYWGYPANAAALKYFVSEIYPLVIKKLPNVKISILGAGAKAAKPLYKKTAMLHKENIKNIQTELSRYRVCAASIVWGSGVKKKIIDAFSAKTPIVTTPVGAEGISGISKSIVCKNAETFADTLVRLYTDKVFWQKQSECGYDIFVKNYTLKNFQKRLSRLLYLTKGHNK
ncbi:MAG: glycosyltransferase [Elusimicrobia bacterium]|nr:glycosyltransferase [Elusimicrobiota bacterium]